MLAQSVAIQDEQNSRDRQLLRVLRSADPADGDIERRLI
jgi:hypothetical protein